ncbi:MAG: InlB B-repeat-containing protein, partial [Clostridiales Family XIII bacterium]|nr:InlB B-repeat-containing protein [Clostridiales Family XIII bacterium]
LADLDVDPNPALTSADVTDVVIDNANATALRFAASLRWAQITPLPGPFYQDGDIDTITVNISDGGSIDYDDFAAVFGDGENAENVDFDGAIIVNVESGGTLDLSAVPADNELFPGITVDVSGGGTLEVNADGMNALDEVALEAGATLDLSAVTDLAELDNLGDKLTTEPGAALKFAPTTSMEDVNALLEEAGLTDDITVSGVQNEEMTWSGTANGVANTTDTTEITLTLSADPYTWFTADNITVTGATKGTLSGAGTTRTLAISGITVGEGEFVTLTATNPEHYIVSPSTLNIAIHKVKVQELPKSHTVKFDAAGGSAVASLTVEEGKAVGNLPVPTRSHYTFSGWYIGSVKVSAAYIVKDDVTFTAKWAIVKNTVTFNGNKGKIAKKSTYKKSIAYNKNIGKLPAAKRAKYTLLGWYTKKSGGSKINAATVIKANKTYYAHWGRNAKVKTSGDTLNLRKGASVTSAKIGEYKNGSKVVILSSKGKWYQVRVGNKTGYMYKQYVKLA